MDLRHALDWAPPGDWLQLIVIDSHAGGEPFRVVLDGWDQPSGPTLLDRRRTALDEDHLRRVLMWEPRGHRDMYGGLVGPPTSPDADISVLFMHNAGFSTMCGHGIIALTKVVLETGALPTTGPETTIRIDTPAGLVTSTASVSSGVVTGVRFLNVPSYVVALERVIDVDDYGQVPYDLAFGGAFYAYVDAKAIGIGLDDVAELVSSGQAIKQTIAASTSLTHPLEPDLGFLYGVIFVGRAESAGNHSRHVCVFADGEVDRSPTGTGVSGRLALLHARGEVELGEGVIIESIVGSTFGGRVVRETELGSHRAIIPEVSGTAHITGRSTFWVDPRDPLGGGFLLQ